MIVSQNLIHYSIYCCYNFNILHTNCSIMNEHAIYIGLLAATTFVLLDRYLLITL